MEKKHSFKLVEGTFSPEDAREVLLELVNNKIRYHNFEIFSKMERTGETPVHSIKRKAELLQTYEELRSLVDLTEREGFDLQVRSAIEVTLLERSDRSTATSSSQEAPREMTQ